MTLPFRLFACAALLASAIEAHAADTPRASEWRSFSEVRARLVIAPPLRQGEEIKGALELRLAPGFKTYWRNPGDSGAPPQFDFSRSTGLGPVDVHFPFPERFDDGAGGQAVGYKSDVLIPITAPVQDSAAVIRLSLDFAVCGTMCIPLKGEFEFDPKTAARVPALAEPLRMAHAKAPRPLIAGETNQVRIDRLGSTKPQRFRVTIPQTLALKPTEIFVDSSGHFVSIARRETSEYVEFLLDGHASPGSGGRFGVAHLVFGAKSASYSLNIDLDALPALP